MKNKILTLLILISIAINSYAQQKVTKFLGIPIDGYKIDMIHKLEKKGFIYDSKRDCLKGEFNGHDVDVFVVTNNNKVYRIMLADQNWSNESDIKIRFNKLCSQFEKNGKYIKAPLADDYKLTDEDNLSYQMLVDKKRIEAVYYQIDSKEEFQKEIDDYKFNVPDQITDTIGIFTKYLTDIMELFTNRPVWFMIDEKYGEYRILMYYDNELNHSDGEDL